MSTVYYAFRVRGTYPNGNKAEMSGHVQDETGYPFSAFDKAVAVCQEITPGLIVDRAAPVTVTLRKLKGKPRR